eukprot:366466-Chlamydomonas_euryale.AAC.7
MREGAAFPGLLTGCYRVPECTRHRPGARGLRGNIGWLRARGATHFGVTHGLLLSRSAVTFFAVSLAQLQTSSAHCLR